MTRNPEDGLPSLVPEAPVRSQHRGTIRFLDYLGIEAETENPLLIVETKRPSAELPSTLKPAATYSEVICRGLAGEPLSGEWNKWLLDLIDYLRSVYAHAQKVPRRVVITNGDWLIVFVDPADSFLNSGNRDPTCILVFSKRADIENRYYELFETLEHGRVLGRVSPLKLGELPFYVEGTEIDRAMLGLKLCYNELRKNYKHSPAIWIAPVVFLRSRFGAWLRVEQPPEEHELPHDNDQLPTHLNQIQRAAEELLAEVNLRLGVSLQPVRLSRHFEDQAGFEAIGGVADCGVNEYVVVTGDKTHFILHALSVLDCPYHDWVTCNRAGVASNPGPVTARSTSPRSFFVSGEPHHCAHCDVSSAKATPITSANRGRCGPRSGKDSQAFCEIWRFEVHLCCRACVFEEVCAKSTVFQLPCGRKRNTEED